MDSPAALRDSPSIWPQPSSEDEHFGMANLRQTHTGLPMVIWVSERGYARHAPRIKVSKNHGHKFDSFDAVSVSIEEPIEIKAGSGLSKTDLEWVKQYIRCNRTALLDYWEGEIDTVELIERLVSVSECGQ
jgi:hypothetical protein